MEDLGEVKGIFIKNPFATKLGKNIVKVGVSVLREMGFEQFTFKKLAKILFTSEASIYRYFESKQQFLSFLISYYWRTFASIANDRMNSTLKPGERISQFNAYLCHPASFYNTSDLDISDLHEVVIEEFLKNYFTRDFKKGKFLEFEEAISKIEEAILEVNPEFYPRRTLVLTLISTAHQQLIMSRFFKSGEISSGGKEEAEKVERLLTEIVRCALGNKKNSSF